jgi:hypothetical protein
MTIKSRAQREYENFGKWAAKNRHVTVNEEHKEYSYFLEKAALQIEYAIEYAYGDTNAKEQSQDGFKKAIASMNYYRRRMEAESFFLSCRKIKEEK